MPLPEPGVIFSQMYSDYYEAISRLDDAGPPKLSDWPLLTHCIPRGSGFMLSSFGGPEIAFDPQNQQEGIYTIYGETGRINAVHDLSAEKFAGACPFVLRDFPIKYRIVTVSVRPPGYKRVWFAGINLSSN